jgi:predicted amidophosphoribosyltransferase
LVRVRATAPQVGHDRVHRWQNVRDAFAWRGPVLEGRSLMVVDDVATTGATLEACASALKLAGAGPVIGVTVARVRL